MSIINNTQKKEIFLKGKKRFSLKSAKTRNATVFTDYSNHEARPSIPLRARNHPAPSIFLCRLYVTYRVIAARFAFLETKGDRRRVVKNCFPHGGYFSNCPRLDSAFVALPTNFRRNHLARSFSFCLSFSFL